MHTQNEILRALCKQRRGFGLIDVQISDNFCGDHFSNNNTKMHVFGKRIHPGNEFFTFHKVQKQRDAGVYACDVCMCGCTCNVTEEGCLNTTYSPQKRYWCYGTCLVYSTCYELSIFRKLWMHLNSWHEKQQQNRQKFQLQRQHWVTLSTAHARLGHWAPAGHRHI